MEKAKLILSVSKKKKVIATLRFGDGKAMPLQHHDLGDASLNDAEVEVEREGGKVVLVKTADKVLYDAQSQSKPSVQQGARRQHQRDFGPREGHSPATEPLSTQTQASVGKDGQNEHINYVRNPAYAPYNFVPLNREVVEINPTIPDANKYDTSRNTGWIEVEIEALTPLYIRGTLTEDEVKNDKESKDKPEFCAPAGRIRIPGSSLRGMVRNMVEMVSFGRFHFFEDRRLYYRGLADRSNLRTEYQKRMSSFDSRTKSTTYKMNAGYLIRDGNRYGIIPAQNRNGKQFDRVKKKETARRLKSAKPFKFDNYTFFEHNGNCIVISGNMPNKKHDWEINPPDKHAKAIWIDEEDVNYEQSDVQNYYLDRNRNAVNLIKELENNRTLELPCFYVSWIDDNERKRVSFGHTAMFRLAYEHSIGDHITTVSHRIHDQALEKVKQAISKSSLEKVNELNGRDYTEGELTSALKSKKLNWNEIKKVLRAGTKIDFTDAIFGNEYSFAGRVFFEDAFLTAQQSDPQLDAQTPQILSAPKPTTFQHYLLQNSDEVRQLNHYNSDTELRGYKYYWHKSGENWTETDDQAIEKHGTQYTRIRPVRAGIKFNGRIRFENLSDKELGALLFALDLPEGCAHKLGMGKPLGLGSVRVTPKLYLSNREKRYTDFFEEWDNEITESDKGQQAKGVFEQYVLGKLNEKSKRTLWEASRLRELLAMLHTDAGLELEINNRTRYMTIEGQNEFKNRPVLPKASNMVPVEKIDEMLERVKRTAVLPAKTDDDSEKVVQRRAKPIRKVKRIKKIAITGLWDKTDFTWELNSDVNILVGINGSGKTTILELIEHALKGEYDDVRYAPREFAITFDEDMESKYERRKLVSEYDCRISTEFVSTFDKENLLVEDAGKRQETIDRQLSAELDERIRSLRTERESLSSRIESAPHVEKLKEIAKDVFKRTGKTLEFVSEFFISNDTLKQIKAEISEDDYVKLEEIKSRYRLAKKWRDELEAKKVPSNIINRLEKLQTNEFETLQTAEIEIETAIGADHFSEHKEMILLQIDRNHVFKPDSEFLDILKSRLGKDKAQKICPVLLKHFRFDLGDFVVLRLPDGQRLIPALLSAGEKQMLIILLTALTSKIKSLTNKDESCVFIMDEPEISLHLEWQKNLINYIQMLNEDAQIIIATHSPGIAMEGWLDKTFEMHKLNGRARNE